MLPFLQYEFVLSIKLPSTISEIKVIDQSNVKGIFYNQIHYWNMPLKASIRRDRKL